MTREQLERKRVELVEQRKKLEAALLRLQGAIAVLDELLEGMSDGRGSNVN